MRDMDAEEQGFMTSEGRFVNRKEAKEIALAAHQISKTYPYYGLYSEHVDWNIYK